jgi:hypothetical protein
MSHSSLKLHQRKYKHHYISATPHSDTTCNNKAKKPYRHIAYRGVSTHGDCTTGLGATAKRQLSKCCAAWIIRVIRRFDAEIVVIRDS